MFDTALYAVNFGDFFYENLDCFADFVAKLGFKEIILIHVIDINKLQHSLYSRYNKEDEEKIKEIAEDRFKEIKKDLEKYGFGIKYKIRVGNIADEIANEADKENVDFIVLDKKTADETHRRKFFAFYGSPIYEILMKSNKPILITKRNLKYSLDLNKNGNEGNFDYKGLFDDVLFATDFSDSSLKAVPFLNNIPPNIIQKMTLLTALDEKMIDNRNEKDLDAFELKIAEKFENIIQDFNYRFTKEKSNLETVIKVIKRGCPCKEINNFIVQTGKKLLVIGFKGRDKEKGQEIFFGSTAERIISALPCSILVVK
jgi:nucleotide-binding universal stress UspA family protein